MVVQVLIVWAVIAAAIALVALVERRRAGDGGPPEYSVVLGFVGSAYGLLLGLLVVFAVGHYSDAGQQAENEATSLVSLYDALNVYPPQTRVGTQHELVCYMRSIVADDWPSMESGATTETPRALAFGDRLRATARGLPVAGRRQASAYSRAAKLLTKADQSRQQLLFLTEPEIPTALWVVIYVGAFLLVFLIASSYIAEPRGRVIALGSLTVLLTVVLAVLGILDRPFGGEAGLPPDQLQQGLDLLSEHTNPATMRPCTEPRRG